MWFRLVRVCWFHKQPSAKFAVGLTRGGLARAGEDALTEGSCADLQTSGLERLKPQLRGVVEPSAKAMLLAWGKEQVGSIRNAPDARTLQQLEQRQF